MASTAGPGTAAPSFRTTAPSRFPFSPASANGKHVVCVNFKEIGGARRIVVIGGDGNECARRDLTGDYASLLKAADLNGDGSDELVVWYGDRVRILTRDLKDLWSWRDKSSSVDQILPAASDRPGEVILPGALALDGATGLPRWTGQLPLVYWPQQFVPTLLDAGNSTRQPLLIGTGLGATVCRVALPATPEGTIAAPKGAHAQRRRIPDDPRWTRSLPWLDWLKGPFGLWGFVAAIVLALIVLALPVSILRLSTGRRRFSIRALMVLPVVVALQGMSLLLFQPFLPVVSMSLTSSDELTFAVGVLAGLPLVFYFVWFARSLARLQFRTALALAAVTVLSSLAVAAVWLWFDMKSMPSIERYGAAGWYLVGLPGTLAAAILSLFAAAAVALYRVVKRPLPRG